MPTYQETIVSISMDIEKIPEPITMTAAVAMFRESDRSRDLCAVIAEHCLKEQKTNEMQEAVDLLRDQFMRAPPPGLDEKKMTRQEAEKLALAVVGIGGIVTIHDELESVIYDTIEAVVDGTRAAIRNFGDFVSNNE